LRKTRYLAEVGKGACTVRTLIGVNDPQAVKKWASLMAVAINKASYWAKKFVGAGKDARLPIQRIDDLESGAGDEVTVDLLMPLSMEPLVGDETHDGKEQKLKYFTDRLRIDQVRGGADLGSRMTKKRTLRNLRQDAKRASTDWWKRLMDELYFIYLPGTRGTGGGMLWSAGNPIFEVNPLTAPDSMHMMYGGSPTSKASLTAADSFKLRQIDTAVAKAETMGGDGTDEMSMIPVSIEGGDHYIALMHTYQADAMRQDAGTGGWLDIQKAAAAAEGAKNPIFTGAMGMYNDVILRKLRNVIPARSFIEPCWETGEHVPWNFRRADGQLWGLAGLWDTWTDFETGEVWDSYTMLTLNANLHPLMSRMHKLEFDSKTKMPLPIQDKRSLVPLEAHDFDRWLTCIVEEARSMLELPSVDLFDAAPLAVQQP
jgi:N4-gp56 family major capsid protein